jgi:putative ABC transport system permease protein
MQSVADPPLFRINRLYVRASENAFDTLTASTATQSGSASVTSRAHEYDKVHDSPLIKGTEQGFQIGTLIAAAYSALAVAVAMALTERSRARDLASLRTLGLSGSQVRGLIVVEQVPLVLVALVVGIALGIAMVRLIEPGIDLTAFTGPGIPVSIDIDYGAIAALATALMTVVGVTIGVVSTVARRANLGRSLRLGDD